MKILRTLLIGTVGVVSLSSCNRYLDITPTGQVIPQTQEDFRAFLTRGYNIYPDHKALTGLKSDEVKAGNNSETLKAIFTWGEGNATPGSVSMPYASLYQTIFHTNYILENAEKTVPASAELNQLLGEALALRAYTYFELINLYAPVYNGSNGSILAVPLVTSPQLEGDFPKATLDQIYAQIFADINKAETLINQTKFEVGLNYRFTKTALFAFKARIYQYRGEWAQALAEAEKTLTLNSELEDFNKFTILPSHFNSKESIMNLDTGVSDKTSTFINVSDAHISLFDQTNDLRFTQYFKQNGNSWQTTKYKSNNFKVTFRVGEIMLIKAEAQFKTGKESDSKVTLLTLAKARYNTAGLTTFEGKINGLSGESYYKELLDERARETSFEGLRWFDLRRTTQPEIIHIFDGTTYTLSAKDIRYTIPFPTDAKLRNPSLL